MEESKNLAENIDFSEETPVETNTSKKLPWVVLFTALLSVSLLIIVFFLYSDDSENVVVQPSSAEIIDENQKTIENNQLPIVQEVHFPNTSRFYIKPIQESPNSFVVRDDKGLSLYNVGTRSVNPISLYDVVPNLKLGDYTKVGKLVLFDTGEGVGVYDLDTKKTQIYTTQDGLVDKSNIKFHPDPYDSNIVWIGSFRGSSRFDLTNRSFRSYTKEIGISGSVWQPRVFYIDQNTVWVTIAANAYNSGGVARLDKTSGIWTAWGTETFVDEGEVNNRVDPNYASVGSENNIVIEEDNTEYIFDRELQIWSVLRIFNRTEPIARGLHLTEDWYYYNKQNELHAYNIVTTDTLAVDYTEIFNNAVGTDLRTVDIEYDETYRRYLLRPSGRNFVEFPYIVTFSILNNVPENIELFDFADIYNRYQYVDVEILDVADAEMVMKTRNSVVLYDLQKHQPIFELDNRDLLSDGFDVKAKLYPNALVIHVAEYCDGMCLNDSGYNGTTTVWGRGNGELELFAPFNSLISGWKTFWTEESIELTLHLSHTEPPQSFAFNLANRSYQETAQHPELNDEYIGPGEFVSLGDIQYVPGNINEERNILKVTTSQLDGTEETHRITLPMLVNAFGGNPGYKVTDAVLNEDTAWFLTDRGLVKFSLETKQWKIYSSQDGLNQDEGSQLYVAGGQFVIDNRVGVGVYKYTEQQN